MPEPTWTALADIPPPEKNLADSARDGACFLVPAGVLLAVLVGVVLVRRSRSAERAG